MGQRFKLPRFRKMSQKAFDMRTGILKKAVELATLSVLPYIWVGSGDLKARILSALGLVILAICLDRLVGYMFDHERDFVKPTDDSVKE